MKQSTQKGTPGCSAASPADYRGTRSSCDGRMTCRTLSSVRREGSMQDLNRDGAAAEHEQSVWKKGGTGRPDFAEELLPTDEEMLEKDLSESDTLGLELEEGGNAAGLLDAVAGLPSSDEMMLREEYRPTSPVYSSIALPEEDEVRAPNKKRPHAVASSDAVPEPEEQRSTSRGQRRTKMSLQPVTSL
ncbi:hypothetical protein KFL_008030060 [Klebsormidium nitens]|uniref:Uncharacterized protein n=1 Tax=Klebsormidium nitens TaxID=105231 RepID=A0A1Y1ILJ8_KLENI|nr:hypothetical protein KFL_008030060 [Klebsormidium nitens]|eukprot:GAQ91543.1 hypothetical protein KFL_008030060 [Klebsormidium nitens]